jgi:ABC-2 type transport system permease protein
MYYVIKIDFGDNIFYLLLICLLGSLTGLSLGAAIGVWVKKKAEIKEAVLLIFVLGGGFLSGMMFVDMKFIVDEKFPLIGYINPVNLVTDAMYSLYYYDTYERFYLKAVILCIITVLLSVASYVGIRRRDYASI